MFEDAIAFVFSFWEQISSGTFLQMFMSANYGSFSFVLFFLIVAFDFSPRLMSNLEWTFNGEGAAFTDHIGVRLAWVLVTHLFIIVMDAILSVLLPAVFTMGSIIAIAYYFNVGARKVYHKIKTDFEKSSKK